MPRDGAAAAVLARPHAHFEAAAEPFVVQIVQAESHRRRAAAAGAAVVGTVARGVGALGNGAFLHAHEEELHT